MPNHTDVGISQANDLLYTNLMQNPHDPDVRLSHFCNRQGSYVVYHRRHVQLICCNLPSEVKWIFKGSGEFLLCVWRIERAEGHLASVLPDDENRQISIVCTHVLSVGGGWSEFLCSLPLSAVVRRWVGRGEYRLFIPSNWESKRIFSMSNIALPYLTDIVLNNKWWSCALRSSHPQSEKHDHLHWNLLLT